MVSNKRLRQRIEALLAQHPHCRDDDQRLMCNVWREEFLERYGVETYKLESFNQGLFKIASGEFSKPESIRRTRQKIQELQPLLRGKTYQARQKHQGEVKKEIRAFK